MSAWRVSAWGVSAWGMSAQAACLSRGGCLPTGGVCVGGGCLPTEVSAWDLMEVLTFQLVSQNF